jgi:hypothetical protein
MQATMKALRGFALAGLTVTVLGACSQLGQVGNVLGGVLGGGNTSGANEVQGQIRYVDTNNQVIQLTTSSGQTGNVMFDNRTTVSYQNQQYSVTSLEQGDVVTMRVYQDNNGRLYTDAIVVQQDARGGTGNGGYNNGGYNNGGYNNGGYNNGSVGTNFVRAEGTVGAVDYNRGLFQLRTSYGTTMTVAMSNNLGASDRDAFNRLRTGDYVRLEGSQTSQNQIQLSRFVR